MALFFQQAVTVAFAGAEQNTVSYSAVSGTARLVASSTLTSGTPPLAPWFSGVGGTSATLNYPASWTGTAVVMVFDDH